VSHIRLVPHSRGTVAGRKGRGLPVTVVVPTAVRVEAGWDRTMPEWAFLNRLLIGDITLDGWSANIAASIRQEARVSVADAHIGAVIQAAVAAKVTVITSDPEDIRRVAGDREVNVVTI
jgi:hypothetical protein